MTKLDDPEVLKLLIGKKVTGVGHCVHGISLNFDGEFFLSVTVEDDRMVIILGKEDDR
jgi:hypothetical protein